MELGDSKIPNMTEFKTNPDGWETTSKNQDGNIWEITQREEDILLQEFERRIAFSKFQVQPHLKHPLKTQNPTTKSSHLSFPFYIWFIHVLHLNLIYKR